MASKGNNGDNGDTGEMAGQVMVQQSRLNRMTRMMEMEATQAVEEASFQGDDILSIFEAESKEDMYEADNRQPLSFKDMTGCEIEIIDISVKFSKRTDITSMFRTEDGRLMYLLVRAFRTRKTGDEKKNIKLPEIGEVFQADTSARFVVAKLMWLHVHGEVDADQGITEKVRVVGTPLGDGQEVVKLMPVQPVTVNA